MQRPTSRAMICSVTLALLVASCGSMEPDGSGAGGHEKNVDGATETASAPGECTTERIGGELTFGTPTQTTSLDPAMVSGTSNSGGLALIQIYDTLMRYDTKTGEYEPRMAKSLESNDNLTTWTLSLRDDIAFSSGNPLNAAAVKSSIERYVEVGTSVYVALAKEISNMEVVDDQTLIFTLQRPWAGFPFLLANTPGMIVDTAAVRAAGETFGRDPVQAGAGPYTVSRFAVNEEIVFTAREDYWSGPVCIRKLRLVSLPSDNGRYEAFEAGDFEVALLTDPKIVAETLEENIPGVSTFKNAARTLLFNAGDSAAPTSDVRIRKAVAKAIDVEKLDQRLNQGKGIPTKSILAKTSVYYDDKMQGNKYAPEAARRLFSEVKAEGWDGSLNLLCSKERRAVAVAAFLEAAGAEVELDIITDVADRVKRIFSTGNFEVACWGQNAQDAALWATINPQLISSSPTNPGDFADKGVDEALAQLRVADTKEETTAAMIDLQERWAATVPSVVLNALRIRTIHVPRLKGLLPTSNALVIFGEAYLAE